jgi:hypothetical protein
VLRESEGEGDLHCSIAFPFPGVEDPHVCDGSTVASAWKRKRKAGMSEGGTLPSLPFPCRSLALRVASFCAPPACPRLASDGLSLCHGLSRLCVFARSNTEGAVSVVRGGPAGGSGRLEMGGTLS